MCLSSSLAKDVPLELATRTRVCFNQPRFPISTRKDRNLATNCNYNHYNLPFSHMIIIVITLGEDMLFLEFPFKFKISCFQNRFSDPDVY